MYIVTKQDDKYIVESCDTNKNIVLNQVYRFNTLNSIIYEVAVECDNAADALQSAEILFNEYFKIFF